jgi:hypothetical protein
MVAAGVSSRVRTEGAAGVDGADANEADEAVACGLAPKKSSSAAAWAKCELRGESCTRAVAGTGRTEAAMLVEEADANPNMLMDMLCRKCLNTSSGGGLIELLLLLEEGWPGGGEGVDRHDGGRLSTAGTRVSS